MCLIKSGSPVRGMQILAGITAVFFLQPGEAWAANASRFLGPDAWQCTFNAQMHGDVQETTGPGGMANDPKRQLFQALESTGVKMDKPGGNTDSYHQVIEQSVDGEVRLHSKYDGGLDGIQIAGWNNGGAEVRLKSSFEGTEQNRTVLRDKTASHSGFAKIEGDEYSPGFQIWIYPEEGTYSLDYALSAVTAQQVEHCRMTGGMEEDRKKMESATDADMPLGDFMSGLTRFTCATESRTEVELDGGALSGYVENVPIPRSGLLLEGEGQSAYIDSGKVVVRWSCQPD
jgi:hypothetical protein